MRARVEKVEVLGWNKSTAIVQGGDKFYGAYNEFEAARAEENSFGVARAEESAARARLQRAGDLSRYATRKANEREEEKSEGNASRNFM